MFTPEGNIDSEGLGGSVAAQSFPDVPGGGNVMSDTANFNAVRSTARFDYYEALGKQLMSALQGPATMDTTSQNTSGDALTSGFDNNWLAERLAAGSANGAKIGGALGK